MKIDDKLQYRLYIIGVFSISLKALLSFSSLFPDKGVISIIHMILGAIFIGCLVLKLILQSYSKVTFVVIALIGICCVYTYYKVNYYYLICSFFCIVAVSNIDIKKVCNVLYKLNTTFLSMHVIIYWIVYFVNPAIISYSYRSGIGKPRHYFFMGHANTFSMYVTWTCLGYIYSNYDKLTRKNIFIVWLINVVCYYFTDSNTSIIVATFVCIAVFFEKSKSEYLDKLVHIIAKYFFAVCSIGFPLLIIMYINLNGFIINVFNMLNRWFTGRLISGAFIYNKYGWTLLGKEIYFSGKEYWRGQWFDSVITDNTYLWMFVSYGYIYLILLSLAFIIISNKTKNIEKILIIAYIFYGIMESYIINAVFCFPLLFIGKYLLDNSREEKEKDGKRKNRMVGYR